MSHYAKVTNGIVTQVIVAEAEFFDTFVDTTPGEWIQTSYNTHANTHTLGGTPLRGNFAGIGFTYDTEHDVFYAPRPSDPEQGPYNSWVIGANTNWIWQPPTERPAGQENSYPKWIEANTTWVMVTSSN
jgi:hypothetical protein